MFSFVSLATSVVVLTCVRYRYLHVQSEIKIFYYYKERGDTVYHIHCKDYTSNYVGESAQPFGARLSQHKRKSSEVGKHIASTDHAVNWDKAKILDRESNWFRRGVKESIQIRRHKPDLNDD